MIGALAGAAAGLFCVVGGLMFWGLRRTVTRAAAAPASAQIMTAPPRQARGPAPRR